MASAGSAGLVLSPRESGQLRLEIVRQLRLVSAHSISAALLAARAERAVNPLVAQTLWQLADRRRVAAERSRETLAAMGVLLPRAGTVQAPDGSA
jgi:hypothetical protein